MSQVRLAPFAELNLTDGGAMIVRVVIRLILFESAVGDIDGCWCS